MTARVFVVVLGEQDYRYGTGELRLRVESVDRAGPIEFDGEPWLQVRGVRLRRDGTEVGRLQVLVRAARLPAV
ncbi:hypothetical protein GCM10009827_070700 [Dactylosporangium maewongense]|uniref:Uncharacterized protein n=1 Tax=Dactylosporangium maewongense TaxID=634393 RepID=A0ABN2BKN5_9ACTN